MVALERDAGRGTLGLTLDLVWFDGLTWEARDLETKKPGGEATWVASFKGVY